MSHEDVRESAERALEAILADSKFSCAPRMSAFLSYVVKQTLDGNADRIKAYTIGVEALGKPESFDPQSDPSVRVLAKRLRSSLADYHQRHPDLPLVIDMRCGHYRALFLKPSQAARPEPAPRRPVMPVIRIVETHAPHSIGAQLASALSGLLARRDYLKVVRRPHRAETLWPEDYELSIETMRLPETLRVELQLMHASDGGIVHSAMLQLGGEGGHEGGATAEGDATEPAILQEALGGIERFVDELAATDGKLLADYGSRGDMSPFVVARLHGNAGESVSIGTPSARRMSVEPVSSRRTHTADGDAGGKAPTGQLLKLR